MQTDIEDGLNHLVDEGLVDPNRACIMGASYGGYAALAATVLTPDIYKCAISIAGPSDLIEMLKWVRREEGRNSEELNYWIAHIGDPNNDEATLDEVSPARHADLVGIPMLLIHGELDGIVPIEQSELMEEAMIRAGKPVRFIHLEHSRHSFRTDNDKRLEYREILAFLSEHLPVEEAALPAPLTETSP